MMLLDVMNNTVVEVAPDSVAQDTVEVAANTVVEVPSTKDQEGITAQTWFITGLGFGMVVLLLFAFVYVMKLMGWIMQPRVKAKKVENKAAEQTVTHTHSKLDDSITLTADSTAAIALALHLYYNGAFKPGSATTSSREWRTGRFSLTTMRRTDSSTC